ncbi:MAG: NAD-dependent epimerase/dehydratase family protein [Planctomycetes bacterium]|nr:NAD-dependent epimerase/dehydratase family protein [Planctomycetota bacterium]
MRAFITGITGFAGSFLAEHLLACGDAVLGCSRDGLWENGIPPTLEGRVEVVAWDVGEAISPAAMAAVREFAPDAIYHLAGLSIPAECGAEDPTLDAIRINVGGTERAATLAASLPTRPRVLFVSSCRVYAPVDFQRPYVKEMAPLAPQGGYGKSKLAAEDALRRQAADSGIEAIVVRACNHAGPRQSPRLMLSEWCRRLARGDDPVQVHSLNSYLDMTDVRDVVRAYRLLIERGRAGEAYNVGGGVSLRSGDIFEQLRQMHDPGRRFIELSPGPRQEPIADLTKLQSTIDWRPEIPLETTLRDTLDYWLARRK